MHRKQIELWGIKSTSGNFRSYQIQTAIIHFKIQCRLHLFRKAMYLNPRSYILLLNPIFSVKLTFYSKMRKAFYLDNEHTPIYLSYSKDLLTF